MIINNLIKVQNKLTDIIMQWWNTRKIKSYGRQVFISGGQTD